MILKILKFLVTTLNVALTVNHIIKQCICIFKFHNSHLKKSRLNIIKSSQNIRLL